MIYRLPAGGLIDRQKRLDFTFNGRRYQGHPGDTLASALLANGVRLVARSLKYHRPRGFIGAGVDDPNGLVDLIDGDQHEPNTQATTVPLRQGLQARGQNAWPSVNLDLGAVSERLSPLIPAGFYYKTFKWPAGAWKLYEWIIRRAAGTGQAPQIGDSAHYDHRHLDADVAIVGGGTAGLAAALAAAASGACVVLIEQDCRLGGALLHETARIDGLAASDWAKDVAQRLDQNPRVTVLTRATAFGLYDDRLLGVVQHAPDGVHRQRLCLLRAKQLVIAAGAIERPIAFANNDRPGVLLASAARAFVNRWAIALGRQAVVFTSTDSAYAAASDLRAKGITIAAIVDARPHAGAVAEAAVAAGFRVLQGHVVLAAQGRRSVEAVRIGALASDGLTLDREVAKIDCDLLLVSGGWTPTRQLLAHIGSPTLWSEALQTNLPADRLGDGLSVAGAARGRYALADALADGATVGAAAAQAAGFATDSLPAVRVEGDELLLGSAAESLAASPRAPGHSGKRFVDLQNDVTVDDIELAAREGYVSIEHVKRYTALGMGGDQGKTGNPIGAELLARWLGKTPAAVGSSKHRPPYTPVTFGAWAGPAVGALFDPVRRSPLHDCHREAYALLGDSAWWRRPRYYPRLGENAATAIRRETANVRRNAGIVDISTLGKIEVRGTDAARFLDWVYASRVGSLAIGRSRYGLLLREDGRVLDDGTVSRLADDHFLLSTSTTVAERVLTHLERAHQVWRPQWKLRLHAVTEQWGGFALSGPRAREIVGALAPDFDVSAGAFRFLDLRLGTLGDVPVRVFRISFSGELAFEIFAPARRIEGLWRRALAAGAPLGLQPYGLEALDALRIEKGHVTGSEIDGRTTPDDLGLTRFIDRDKEFVGSRALALPDLRRDDRLQLVGLLPHDPEQAIPGGAQLIKRAPDRPGTLVASEGPVTASAYSPAANHGTGSWIALALVKGGRTRLGETLIAASPITGSDVPVTLTNPNFVDPEGSRLHG